MYLSSAFVSCTIIYSSLLFRRSVAINPGQLGVQVNTQLLQSAAHKLVIGSIAEIAGLSGWTDQQIVDLAYVARGDSTNAFAAYYAHNPRAFNPGAPRVTAVLVVDDTAYIASSLKGGPYLYLPTQRELQGGPQYPGFDPAHPCEMVNRALTDCQVKEGKEGIHRTGAACGEVMCVLAFCMTQNQQSIAGARVVAISGTANPRIIPPCGDPQGRLRYAGEWGCHDFAMAKNLGLNVISSDTGRTSTDVSSNDITITYATYP